ncbi:MAG: monovalent cation/H+ antiporter complex subunit F [Tepidisphaerales bacterium]
MSPLLAYLLVGALILHLLLAAYCVYRVWLGYSAADRLVGADLVGILSLSVLVLIAVVLNRAAYIDVAVALAAVGFVVTLLLAKFIADGHADGDSPPSSPEERP